MSDSKKNDDVKNDELAEPSEDVSQDGESTEVGAAAGEDGPDKVKVITEVNPGLAN